MTARNRQDHQLHSSKWRWARGAWWRVHPRESKSESRMRTEMHKTRENIPEGVVGRLVLSLSNLGLPSLHGDLLYSSPSTPSSAQFWTVQLVILTVTSRHSSRLTFKFSGAWWPRVAGWRCFSGFMVKRNSCSTSLACLFSDWIRFSRKKIVFVLGRSEPDFGFNLLPCHFTMKKRWWRLLFLKTTCTY